MVRRLLAKLSPQDSIYPGVLFTAGRIAADATSAATNLQRVVVEYGRSAWADSALVLLTQLYFAQGDPAATVQAAERLRLDYPDSSLRPRADFWGARAYFDLKDDAHGCSLIREALDGAGADVEFKNQVTFYASRCARSEEHTSELQSRLHLVCRLLLEKKKKTKYRRFRTSKDDDVSNMQ